MTLPLTDCCFTVGIENAKHFEAYERALQGAERLTMRYLKFIFFGLPRSGKSSTLRRLIREIVNLREVGGVSKSTGVAESSEVIIKKLTSAPAAIIKSDQEGESSQWQSLNNLGKVPKKKSKMKKDRSMQGVWRADHKYLAQVFYHLISRSRITNDTKKPNTEQNEVSNTDKSGIPETPREQNIPYSSENTREIDRASRSTEEKETAGLGASENPKHTGEKVIESAIEKLTTLLKSNDPEEFQLLLDDLTLLNMIDAGGQPAFVEMLPALTIGSALYLLFFRMDQELRKVYPVRFLASEKDRDIVLESSYCTEDVLCQSLSTVACFSSFTTSRRLPSQQSISRAILFGTHKDEVEKQGTLEARITEINNTLWETLSGIQTDLLIKADKENNFFPVDNMDGNDNIDRIRMEIDSVVQQVFPPIEIPPSWLMFRILLHLLNKPVVSLGQCRLIARKVTMPTSVEEAVWFFHHNIGSLMHYPEIPSMEDVVICDTQVVFDSVSELIIDTFSVSNRAIPESAVREFQDKGLFTLEHIECSTQKHRSSHLTPKQLIDLLKYLNILAEIIPEQESSSQASPKYIIPAVLKCASEDELQPRVRTSPGEEVCSFMIHFDCGFVPFGVFCAGVAHLIAHQDTLSPMWQLSKDHKVKKNKVIFLVDGTFQAILISRPQNLEIQVYQCSGTRKKKSLPEICFSIRQTVTETLETVILKLKYKTAIQPSEERPFHLAFACHREGHSDHLMKVVEGEEERYGVCLRDDGELSLAEKHLVWFSASRVCTY